jgi:RIO kinase 1
VKDKADRATTELVLDPRTLLMLYKLLNKGALQEIHGCVSTGKEANVYWARAGPRPRQSRLVRIDARRRHARRSLDEWRVAADAPCADTVDAGYELAVKIYKTSILVFKDRDRYVTGEFRFRSGYSRKNPRKMVRTWAEKEMRNLGRLYEAGIPCPRPLLLREHVLVMQFLGVDGEAYPRLKDAAATMSEERVREAYAKLVRYMRTLYHRCRLVHADLSEYNVLYHRGSPFIIDVSQSVEHDHPNALVFLRSDCANVTHFFLKRLKLTSVMNAAELFEFVTVHPTELGDSRPVDAVAALCRRIPLALRDNHTDEFAAARQLDADNELYNAAQVDRYLDALQERIAERPLDIAANDTAMTSLLADNDDNGEQQQQRAAAAAATVDERVFLHSHIPMRLDEVRHAERDAEAYVKGQSLIYANLTGLTAMAAKQDVEEEEEVDDADDDVDDVDDVDDNEQQQKQSPEDDKSLIQSDREANKERKRLVREAQKAKRVENKSNGRTKYAKRQNKKALGRG